MPVLINAMKKHALNFQPAHTMACEFSRNLACEIVQASCGVGGVGDVGGGHGGRGRGRRGVVIMVSTLLTCPRRVQ